MKELNYIDPYRKSSVVRGSGFKTNNGIIRVIPNYNKDNDSLEYITITNHNGMKVHVSAKLVPELVEMLNQYSISE